MVMFPLTVSIITPSFNQADFIEDTIRSVLGQTYPNIEHIVVDGGSTDGTLEILRSYGARVRWFSEPDEGQGDAVNKGFALATGDIIAWINADDLYFSPNVFEHVARVFQMNPEADFVYGGIAYTGSAGKLLHVRIPPSFNYHRLLRIPYIQNSNCFLRRAVIERHRIDPTYHYLLDTEFFLRVAREYRGVHTREVLTCFRMHDEQKSQTLSSKSKEEERKRRDQTHSIRADTRFRIGQLFDRILFKLLSLDGEYRLRRRWGENLPYQQFITKSTSTNPDGG